MLNNIRDLGLDISINNILYGNSDFAHDAGADPGFQVRGADLKKLRRAEGGAKILGYFV